MVETGQTNIEAYAALGKQFVIERVQFVSDVTSKHDREKSGDVTILGQQKVKPASSPRDVPAVRLCGQCHLRSEEVRGEKSSKACKISLLCCVIGKSCCFKGLKRQKIFVLPGSFPPLLVLETPTLESQETDVGRYNGETGLLRTL